MQNYEPGLGSGCRPFPQARQSRALEAEDAFMHAHGGWGARLVFCVMTGLGRAVSGAWWPWHPWRRPASPKANRPRSHRLLGVWSP